MKTLSFAHLIVNPVAGAGQTARKLPLILRLLRSIGLRFEHNLTEAPGHARELARLAAGRGYELVVSVGGDGTVNEVVNGLYEAGGIPHVSLGVISTGTGRDYVRTIGLPRTFEDSCRCLLNGKRRAVDVGMVEYTSNGTVEKRLFVNFAGLGFDAEIVRATTRRYKAISRTASYLAGLFRTLLTYHNKKLAMTIDGELVDGKMCTVLMCNGKYAGGGMLTAPEADLSDGVLDVITIGDVSKPDLLWSLPRIYKGTHLTHPKVKLRRAKTVEIQSSERIALQADGETLGHLPARVSIMPAVLKIVT